MNLNGEESNFINFPYNSFLMQHSRKCPGHDSAMYIKNCGRVWQISKVCLFKVNWKPVICYWVSRLGLLRSNLVWFRATFCWTLNQTGGLVHWFPWTLDRTSHRLLERIQKSPVQVQGHLNREPDVILCKKKKIDTIIQSYYKGKWHQEAACGVPHAACEP
jgi:hypothetical protein